MWTFDSGAGARLAAEECLQLLARQGRGLVNVNRHPLPDAVRTRLRVDGSALRLLPDAARRVRPLLVHTDVTLEVDATDLTTQTGWRVVVTGHVDEDLVLHPTDVSGYRLAPTRTG